MITKFEQNLDRVITKIEESRLQVSQHLIVKLVAVSKYSTASDIENMYKCGQRAFGESKVQDLTQKIEELQEYPIEWHFIGNIQKNKINHLIDANPFLIHSLSSLELAYEFDKRLKVKHKKLNFLLQINSSFEDNKGGVEPNKAVEIYNEISQNCSNINLMGIMSMGKNSSSQDEIIKGFNLTKEILNQLEEKYNKELICSMGMSGDYSEAILNGSNMVRVGSALFQ
jgi:pyridoxal phosphate enzyme (YggS family)